MLEVSRRNVARGAAWSVPVMAVAGAAPSVAASGCTPRVLGTFGTHYSYGTIYDTSGRTTTQTLTFGGSASVNNLPDGVTVTNVKFQFWFDTRARNTTGPGAFWMGDSTSDKRTSCGSGVCTIPWSPSGAGFNPTITSTTSNSTQTYPDGTSHQAWDANMSWDAQNDPGTYTTAASGCRNFATGDSGNFVVTYSGVRALTTTDVDNGKKAIPTMVTLTATLSNGQVLTKSYQTSL